MIEFKKPEGKSPSYLAGRYDTLLNLFCPEADPLLTYKFSDRPNQTMDKTEYLQGALDGMIEFTRSILLALKIAMETDINNQLPN